MTTRLWGKGIDKDTRGDEPWGTLNVPLDYP